MVSSWRHGPPLTRLAEAIARDEPPPFDWVVEHAPRGRFTALWKTAPKGDLTGTVEAIFALAAAMYGVDGIRVAALAAARARVPRGDGWGERLADTTPTRDSLNRAAQALARTPMDVYLPASNLLYYAADFPTAGVHHSYVYRFIDELEEEDRRKVLLWVKTTGYRLGVDPWTALPDTRPVTRRVTRALVKAVKPLPLDELLARAAKNRSLP